MKYISPFFDLAGVIPCLIHAFKGVPICRHKLNWARLELVIQEKAKTAYQMHQDEQLTAAEAAFQIVAVREVLSVLAPSSALLDELRQMESKLVNLG